MSDLSSIFRLREVHEKQEAYKKYIDKILKEKNVKALIDTLDHCMYIGTKRVFEGTER